MSVITTTQLITRLQSKGIELAVDGDKLRFRPQEKLTPEDLEHLRLHKPVLLRLLRSEGQSSARLHCSPHNDTGNYAFLPDRYDRLGWHSVQCRICGRFIGYQPPQQ